MSTWGASADSSSFPPSHATWDASDDNERVWIPQAIMSTWGASADSNSAYGFAKPWAGAAYHTNHLRSTIEKPRLAPLKKVTLYVDGRVPAHQPTSHTYYRCSLCSSAKAHPVSYLCGHSHCYACIRIWLETEWSCPVCNEIMTRPPHRHFSEEDAIADMFPEWASSTQVKYSWDWLTFPGY
ncbi:hypothetical protein B0H14DRAFT_3449158 [Mycena olivaceomarginata]|nr:hypothetical protein B0H14DRAFT_3449158 [Mycena olivaceomarginata]